MGQLFQRVRRFGVVFIDMGHLVVGFVVNQRIQQGDYHIPHQHAGDHQPHIIAQVVRMQRLRQQVKTHNRRHYPGGKGQQQADGLAGILPEQAGNQSAQAGTAHTRKGGDADYAPNHILGSLLIC